MAGMIRKASSSVVLPLALRAIGSQSTTLNCTISCQSLSINQSHYFSSVATAKDSVDATFHKLLKHEIKAVKFNLNSQVNALPDSFPYEIDEIYSHRHNIYLKRKFLDNIETVVVIIKMLDVAKAIETSSDYASCEDDAENYMTYIKVPIGVTINKYGAHGYPLRFEITLSAEDIIIESFHTLVDDEDIPHEGTKIKELDNELQQCLYKYLDIRGINNNIISYLHECIAVRRNKIYLKALKQLREFIES